MMSNNKGSRQRCSECGLKKRGSNHEQGQHHLAGWHKRNNGKVKPLKPLLTNQGLLLGMR